MSSFLLPSPKAFEFLEDIKPLLPKMNMIGKAALGITYYSVTSGVKFLNYTGLEGQMLAFCCSVLMQEYAFPKEDNGLENKNFTKILLPYVLIGGTACFLNTALIVNIISTAILSTGLLAIDHFVSRWNPKKVEEELPRQSLFPLESDLLSPRSPPQSSPPQTAVPLPSDLSGVVLPPQLSTEEALKSLNLEASQYPQFSTQEALSSPHLEASQHSVMDVQKILEIRRPLRPLLETYFVLDHFGYIVSPKSALDFIRQELGQYEERLARLFHEVSKSGDAAYADDIRTTLAGMNIASTPVKKTDGKSETGTRPYSYTPSQSKELAKTVPSIYRGNPAYLGKWAHAIWKGYRDFRHNTLGVKSDKSADANYTDSQTMDYERRIDRIRERHQSGWLLGRVADTREVRDFMGHRYNMGNDILSTTLWPQEKAPLTMQLFSEYGTDTVGVLLDSSRVGSADFGVSFDRNAGTVGSGFLNHKRRREEDGAVSLAAQKGLLEALSLEVGNGGSVYDITHKLSSDHKSYEVKRKDVRKSSSTHKSKKVDWNEQTFYRGITRDFFTGFFVKSDSDSFSRELGRLFLLQERIRRKKGICVPVFQFKGATNELEELVPDPLLLSVLGLTGKVEPMRNKRSRFSQELEKVGITQEIALQMAQALPKEGEITSLLELQLLMFNMKDIMGKMTIKVPSFGGGVSFEPVRILDNLHLVFPTIHRTQNADAKQPDLHFSQDDVRQIRSEPALNNYLALTLRHNLGRFLGISVTGSGIQFDPKNAGEFDQADAKKLDFAKVFSRAMQSVILFQIYGPDTNRIVCEIVAKVRQTWPLIGKTPGNIDMILGSKEMQTILQSNGFFQDKLSCELEPSSTSQPLIPVPESPYNINTLDPLDPKGLQLPDEKIFQGVLAMLGLNPDGSVNPSIFDLFKNSDPHLFSYEKTVVQIVQILRVIKQDVLADNIMRNIRERVPSFGYTADAKDSSLVKSDKLMSWIGNFAQQKPPETEFPFFKEAKSLMPALRGRFSRGREDFEEEDDFPVRGGRFAGRFAAAAVPDEGVSTGNQPKVDAKGLQNLISRLNLISSFSKEQQRALETLGLVDGARRPLWEIEPAFHGEDPGKPRNPYIAPKDLLGEYAAHLMTGPAMEQTTLERDKSSFELNIASQVIGQTDIGHLVTHTLAVTVEGDNQVVRCNGVQFSHSVIVPPGGGIEYNGGNEKHRFRSNDPRSYHRPTPTSQTGYQYRGAYFDTDLQHVENGDKQLLSDEERRIKRAGLLPSAYVTVTAQGGYGSERVPLPRAYRILYMETAAPQFEKYGRGAFTYQDGTVDKNELEASDFIIAPSAIRNQKPLFSFYYQEGQIPAHSEVPPAQCSQLDDGDFAKPFVQLKDGALFNREAFQRANDQYMRGLVLPAISRRTQNKPIYLKAILLGGGFFAQTDKAGNLRSEVVNTTLNTYIGAIRDKQISSGSVIEFPRYGDQSMISVIQTLKEEAVKSGIEIVWTPEGDVCDFAPKTTESSQIVDPGKFEKRGTLVVLGAADVMSWSGNERTSESVEAAFANNSNLRLVMNWWANSQVLESASALSLG